MFSISRLLRASSRLRLGLVLPVACGLLAAPASAAPAPAAADDPLLLLVLDPLAKDLACACVKGYAQRDYRQLARWLGQGLGRPVVVEFSDNLPQSLATTGTTRDILLVGKCSVIRADAAAAGLQCQPLASLTGSDGGTSLTGLFVTKTADPAAKIGDLKGRRILFGLANADEKHAAALAALRAAGIEQPQTPEMRPTCSIAVLDMIDAKEAAATPVAVISSYAISLLEGCGSIGKGDIKVIGKTAPIPFVTAFLTDSVAAPQRKVIVDRLLGLKKDAGMLKAMESKDGFVPWQEPKAIPGSGKIERDWPDWRGPERDGRVPWLPEKLPARAVFVWQGATVPGALAGLSVAADNLLLAERDLSNRSDVLRCLDARTGGLRWRAAFPAAGKLDYGEAPRATPVVHDGRVFWLGAFGDLRCLDLANGALVWQRQLIREFGGKLPTWGTCATPLLAGGLLIVNPGAPQASLAALDPATGVTRWTTPGDPAAYGAFVPATLGGKPQVVGHDQHSLGGWDPRSGKRLWSHIAPASGDFHVPTPLAIDGTLAVADEDNGTRLFAFDATGKPMADLLGSAPALAPDTATPVATCGRIFGFHRRLHCLDLAHGLRALWQSDTDLLGGHASLFASPNRVLVVGMNSELILLDATVPECRITSRLRLLENAVESYSHPALVGSRLYFRYGAKLGCIDLDSQTGTETGAMEKPPF